MPRRVQTSVSFNLKSIYIVLALRDGSRVPGAQWGIEVAELQIRRSEPDDSNAARSGGV